MLRQSARQSAITRAPQRVARSHLDVARPGDSLRAHLRVTAAHRCHLFRMAIETVAESAGALTRPSTTIRCRLSARAEMSTLAMATGSSPGVSGRPDSSKYSKSRPVLRGFEL